MKIGFMEYINIGMEAKENMKKVNYIFSILRHFDITKQQRKYPSLRWNGWWEAVANGEPELEWNTHD